MMMTTIMMTMMTTIMMTMMMMTTTTIMMLKMMMTAMKNLRGHKNKKKDAAAIEGKDNSTRSKFPAYFELYTLGKPCQKKQKPENVSPEWTESRACLFSNHHVWIPALVGNIFICVSHILKML